MHTRPALMLTAGSHHPHSSHPKPAGAVICSGVGGLHAPRHGGMKGVRMRPNERIHLHDA